MTLASVDEVSRLEELERLHLETIRELGAEIVRLRAALKLLLDNLWEHDHEPVYTISDYYVKNAQAAYSHQQNRNEP